MKKNSRRLNSLKKLITHKIYSCEEAVYLIKQLSTTKFIESIEAHINLNIDPKYSNQQLRANLILPNSHIKICKIAVYTNLNSLKTIYKEDNIIIGTDEILENIVKDNINFDVLITTPDLMPQLAKLGKILGPKGLMPSPKAGTVTHDLIQTINEFKRGKFEYKADKTGIVHINIGKINFSETAIKENIFAVYSSIEKNKPLGVKGPYFKSFNICTTMSPSLKLELLRFKKI